MKNKIILIFFVILGIILSTNLVNALDISVENYYPTPVEAGDYFNIWLKITNRDNNVVKGGVVKFKPSYPFSLDSGEEQEKVINELEPTSSVTKKFKIRVDKESKEGDNNIAFEYKDCAGCIWEEIAMPITVIELQTMFDVVLQEITSDGVFIAIANIGKNPANAITISVPEQEYFKTDLISASIVGNLESGDYTIAGFKILSKERGIKESRELFVKIDYTDPFGIRRSVVKQVLLNPSSSTRTTDTTNENISQFGNISRGKSAFYRDVWFWCSLILLLFILKKWIKRFINRFKKS